jgi:hypothetical protein
VAKVENQTTKNPSSLRDGVDPVAIANGINAKKEEPNQKRTYTKRLPNKTSVTITKDKITPKVCEKLIKLPFLGMEQFTADPCWRIDKEESQTLGEATADVLIAFLPEKMSDKYTALIALGVLLGSAFGSRAIEWKNNERLKVAKKSNE